MVLCSSRPIRLAVGFVVLVLMGCGPGRGDLAGTVTYQGRPLRFGTVQVLGGDGMPKSGSIKDDGTYEIKDIQAGPVKAMVTSPDPASTRPVPRIPGTPRPEVNRKGWFPIPDTYADFEKSGLTFDLKRHANTWDIELK